MNCVIANDELNMYNQDAKSLVYWLTKSKDEVNALATFTKWLVNDEWYLEEVDSDSNNNK